MVDANSFFSTILYSQTVDWNIKQFFNATSIHTIFALKRVGRAIVRRKDQLTVEDGKKYKRITIRTNCGGVVIRDEVFGERIKTKNQYYVHVGQLAVSKIDARNGAFGIIPKEADGAIITGNFWTYDVDPEIADIDYLILLLASSVFVQAWQDCSNGSGNRLYLQEKQFLNYRIPMPPISEQKRIVGVYAERIKTAEELEQKAVRIETELERWVFDALGIKAKKEKTTQSPLDIVRFRDIQQWGYGKNAVEFPYSFERHRAFSLESNPQWLVEMHRGKSPEYEKDGEGVILNQKCNRKNDIDLRYAKRVNKTWLSQIPDKLLTRENDIIINSTGEGTLGRASVITSKEHVGLACDSHMLLLRVNPEKVDPLLFVYLFNSPLGQKQVDLYKSAQATKQTELGIENTKKILFPLPSISAQREISASIRRETAQANELLERAKKLRQQSKLEFEKTVFGG